MSGYDKDDEGYPTLDSLTIKTKGKEINTNTTTIQTITREKKKRWRTTIGIGAGYGIINKKPDIYAGITFGYSF